LARVIKVLPRIRINHGQVYINICKPFYPKQLIDSLRYEHKALQFPEIRKKIQSSVGREIITKLTEGIVIMSTAIVSSVLLMHRKGIEEDGLIKMVNEVVKYVLKKGYQVGGVNENSSAVAVRNAITYLDGVITKTKKNIFELTISAGG
jgi:glycerol-3-phosphate O-acyltransferase